MKLAPTQTARLTLLAAEGQPLAEPERAALEEAAGYKPFVSVAKVRPVIEVVVEPEPIAVLEPVLPPLAGPLRPMIDAITPEPETVPEWAEPVVTVKVGAVCAPCSMSKLIESGVIVSPVSFHDQCTGPGTCDCGCVESIFPACRECGRTAKLRADGKCVDTGLCAATIIAAINAPRLAKEAKAAKAAATPKAEKAPKRPRTTAPAAKGGVCLCGCGAAVARRFLPGHDAKLASRMLAAVKAGDSAAYHRMIELGWEKKIPAAIRAERSAG